MTGFGFTREVESEENRRRQLCGSWKQLYLDAFDNLFPMTSSIFLAYSHVIFLEPSPIFFSGWEELIGWKFFGLSFHLMYLRFGLISRFSLELTKWGLWWNPWSDVSNFDEGQFTQSKLKKQLLLVFSVGLYIYIFLFKSFAWVSFLALDFLFPYIPNEK